MKTAARFPIQRIAAIDRAIRSGEYPNAVTIARRLEVGHRTVQRDVEFLRDRLGAPLAFDRVRNGYHYTEPDYRLPLVDLTERELVALTLAERVLKLYRGTPYAEDLSRAFDKITAGLPGRVTVDLGQLGEAHSFRTSAASELEPGIFRDLNAAIRGHRRLSIRYYSASSDEETAREVDPYHLTSVDGQFFLVGRCHLREEVRMFVPSRIRSMNETGATFDPPADFRIDDYLAQSFSVLRGAEGEVHHVRLRFTGPAARYVRERTWHPSQSIEEAEGGGFILNFSVGHLREVERFALGWGPTCEVLAPPALREQVARAISEMAAHYP